MDDISNVVLLIMVCTGLFSYVGLLDEKFFRKYAFEIDPIVVHRDYKRLFTSGLLHVGWMHLFLNMITLYFFGPMLEYGVGPWKFAVIYLASLLGGSLLSLFIHRNDPDYSAVGASGAVCGLIFAVIALYPGAELGLILIPVYIPGCLFGLLFVLYSIYGMKSGRDNIGHDAHLGGGLIGMFVAILFYPHSLTENTVSILAIFIPAATFLYLLVTRPEMLYIDGFFRKKQGFTTVEDRYHETKKTKEAELNELLEKIQRSGMKSLTEKEKARLRELSN